MFRTATLIKSGQVNIGFLLANRIPYPVENFEKTLDLALATENFLNAVPAHNEENPSFWLALGFALFAQGQRQDAITAWEKTTLLPAQIFVSRGDYSRFFHQNAIAKNFYEDALSFDSSASDAWYGIGMIEKANGSLDAATLALQKAWDLGHADSAHQLANVYRENQNPEKAIAIWEEALRKYPQHPQRQQWWGGLSNSLHLTEQWEAGVEKTEQALSEFPEDSLLHAELGFMIYKATGDTAVALQQLQRAIELEQEPSYSYSLIATIMIQEQRYQEAYDWYDKSLEQQPGKFTWQIARAHAARESGDFALAQTEFQEIIKQYPESDIAYYGLFLVNKQQKDWETAAQNITRVLTINPGSNIMIYLEAGEIYEKIMDYERALGVYQQILEVDPTNNVALERIEFIQTKLRDNIK